METLYLPISPSSIARYFEVACIKPVCFFGDTATDAQHYFKDALLLSKHQTDCCLEVVLTRDEVGQLHHINNELCLLYNILPISRVKSVYFADHKQLQTTLSFIRVSTAFIPDELCKVGTTNSHSLELNDLQFGTSSISTNTDIANKADLYNRILGAFALMKIAREEYMNFSDRFIATLSYFNAIISEELKSYDAHVDLGLSQLFTKEELICEFSQVLDDNLLEMKAQKCGEIIMKQKYTGLIQLDSIKNKTLYTYAILRTYAVDGDGKRNVADLITTYFSELREDAREAVAMYYGFNRGYDKFANAYSIPGGDKKIDIKFRLESQLDYYLIESVYQYVFNNRISRGFPYIDSWCPKLPTRRSLKDNEYRILDTIISARIDDKKKAGSEEWWSNWQDIFDSITLRDFSWTCIRKNICEPLFKEIITSFKRSENNLNDEIKSLRERISTLEQENDKLKSRNQELEHSLSTQDKIIDTTEVVASTPADIDNRTLDTSTSADEASVVEHNEDIYEPSSNDVDTHIEQSDSEDSLTQKITQENINDQVGNINGAQDADAHQQELIPVAVLTQPISEPTKDVPEVSVNADTFPAPVPKKNTQ